MNKLRRAFITKRWILSIQLDPFMSAESRRLRVLIEKMEELGVTAIDINSSRNGIKQDSLQMASGIQREFKDMISIPHITSRDSLIDALLSQVLGAYTWAKVKSVLVVRGDPKETDGLHNTIPGVYQLDSPELIRLLNFIRCDRKMDLLIGCAFCQNYPNENGRKIEERRLKKKIAFGADFVMTQPIFYHFGWEKEVESLRRLVPVPIIIGLWPVFDKVTLEKIMARSVTGVTLPPETYSLLKKHWEKRIEMQAKWFLSMCKGMKSKGVSGAYIVAPFRKKHYADFLKFLNLIKPVL